MAVPLEKLEDQLSCPICLDIYTSPKQLQCHHVYCQQCLDRHVTPDHHGQLSLTCPDCRKVTPVPASGVAGLQAAFRVNQLLEIVEEHKVATASAEISTGAPQSITIVCTEHDGNEVTLYCETCREAICWECIMKSGNHPSHEYKKLDESFELYKREIALSLKPLQKQLAATTEALEVLHKHHDEISDQRVSVESNIHNAITRLHELLELRKSELISQLDQLTEAKVERLTLQRELLEETQAQLNGCFQFMRENLNQEGVVTVASAIAKQIKELTARFKPDMLEPDTEVDMIFSTQMNLGAKIKSYGKVYASGTPNPSKCCVVGNKVDSAIVGELSTTILQTMNFDCQPCRVPMASISCDLVSKIAGISVSGTVKRRRQSQFSISYQPTVKGAHQLHIKVEGQHILGSPFSISVRSPVEMLRAPILTVSGLMKPDGVAVSQCGKMVVSEGGGHCVTVFSPSGEKLRSFGTHGNKRGQFYCPLGVAVEGDGSILVADCYNHRIQKFTMDGKFVTGVGSKGSGPLQFSYPVGIAVSPANCRVYVTENGNHRIQVLNSDLSYFGTFGTKGSGEGKFNLPWYIAFDSTGNVYVADLRNHCIQVFTPEGDFVKMFGGGDRRELNEPCGVAVDSADRVYVSDCGGDCVFVFNCNGQLMTSFGSKGEGPGHFKWPHGLAVDGNGIVYVCDHVNNRVQLF